MKTVLFVPGFGENLTSRDYVSVLQAITSKGYQAEFVPINWARTTIDDWTAELDAEYSHYDPSQTILAGFSFGAMTAFVSASKRNPSELWLYSLSPYFADDLPGMNPAWLKNIGKHRTESFARLNFVELAKNIHCKTTILVGSVEAGKVPSVARRAKLAHQLIPNSQLAIAEGSDHDVSDKQYIASIVKTI